MNDFSYDVVLCTYNGDPFISEQLKSILEQEIKPSKIIISDDGSNDATLDIIKEIFSIYCFNDYLLVNGEKRGVILNFLSSLNYSTADYIFLSDQDDIWHKNKITVFAQVAECVSLPNLVFSDAKLINSNGLEIFTSFFKYQGLSVDYFRDDSILYKNCVQGASCAINCSLKELVLKSLDIVDIDKLYMHDWWIALLAKYYGNYQFIDQPLIGYRQHSKNQIGASNNKFKFLLYLTNFRQYWRNFRKAILQKEELEKFAKSYPYSSLKIKEERRYEYLPRIKWLLIKLFKQ